MSSTFGIYNSMKMDLWFVIRSSTNESRETKETVQQGVLLKLSPNGTKLIRLDQGEIATSFCFGSEAEAKASIGAGEQHKFTRLEE